MDVNRSLFDAVRYGDLDLARELIDTYGLSYSKQWANGYNLLNSALKNGHADVAELLLSKGSTINSRKSGIYQGNTPLHFAASNGNIKIVEMIINKNARIDAINQYGRTPLINAIVNKATEATKLLLKHGAYVNTIDCFGKSPLDCAIECEHQEIIIMILKKGAAVNVKRNDGRTPLHLAAQKGYQEITTMLLEKGADINARQNDGETPLHLACLKGYQEIMIILLTKGADVNVKDKRGITPVHLVFEKMQKAWQGLIPPKIAFQKSYQEIMTMLLTKGADVNAKWNKGSTFLHLAVQGGYQKVIIMLLTKEADVNAKDENGTSPLHLAVVKGDQEIITMLLEKGADVNAKKNGLSPLSLSVMNYKKSGLTPLHLALKHEGRVLNKTVVELLLQHGAVDIQDEYGKTALYLAAEKGYSTIVENVLNYCPDINNPSNRSSIDAAFLGNGEKYDNVVDALLKYGFILNPKDSNTPRLMHQAVEKGFLKVVGDFLNYGIDVNIRDSTYGFTPLQTAVNCLQKELVKLLISCDADINASDKKGRTALQLTALCNSWRSLIPNKDAIMGEIAKLLLSKGAAVDAKTNDGNTTLSVASESGCASVVEALLEYNASVNVVNEFGLTPLHLATRKGCQKTIIMLLTKGADVNAKSNDGSTPLHRAVHNGNQEIITMLLTKGADINAKREDGHTPLHLAVVRGYQGMVTMLLTKGADVNAKMEDGSTPLHLAVHREDIETILKFGADINSTDNENRTAFYIAFHDGNVESVETLLEHRCDIDGVDCTSEVGDFDYDDTYYDREFYYDGDTHYDSDDNDTYYHRNTRYDRNNSYHRVYDSGRYVYINHKKNVTLVKHHIVKMLAANLYVSKEPLNLVGNTIEHEMRDFCWECEEEIANMKTERINNTNLSFYDILGKTTSSLANYMRNENVLQVFKSDYDSKFPIYGSMIKCNFRKGIERKELLEQHNQIFHFFINNSAELPRECTEKIFSYLGINEMRILIQAFEPLSNSSPNIDN